MQATYYLLDTVESQFVWTFQQLLHELQIHV